MQLIHQPLDHVLTGARVVALRADRRTLAKTRWRACAEDGKEFGFDLHHPFRHGVSFWRDEGSVYVVLQEAEPVLEVALARDPSAVATLAWSLGNLHQSIQVLPDRLRLADEPAVRKLLAGLGVAFEARVDVFQPERAAVHAHHH